MYKGVYIRGRYILPLILLILAPGFWGLFYLPAKRQMYTAHQASVIDKVDVSYDLAVQTVSGRCRVDISGIDAGGWDGPIEITVDAFYSDDIKTELTRIVVDPSALVGPGEVLIEFTPRSYDVQIEVGAIPFVEESS